MTDDRLELNLSLAYIRYRPDHIPGLSAGNRPRTLRWCECGATDHYTAERHTRCRECDNAVHPPAKYDGDLAKEAQFNRGSQLVFRG